MFEWDAAVLFCESEQSLGNKEHIYGGADVHPASDRVIPSHQYFGPTFWIFIRSLVGAWFANINVLFSEFMLRYVSVSSVTATFFWLTISCVGTIFIFITAASPNPSAFGATNGLSQV
jgi:hypothetical protein